jgi:hypothetical protein
MRFNFGFVISDLDFSIIHFFFLVYSPAPILAIYFLKKENCPKGMLTIRTAAGQMMVTRRIYIVI